MKKTILIAAGLLALVLSSCGNKTTDSLPNEPQSSQENLAGTPFEELSTIVEQEQTERQDAMEEADNTEMEYVEGTIPPGTYYFENGNYFLFYADEEGGFSIKDTYGRGTYTYDSETGTYTFDYDGESIVVGGHHIIYKGYYREEDGCLVITSGENLTIHSYDEGEYVFTRR